MSYTYISYIYGDLVCRHDCSHGLPQVYIYGHHVNPYNYVYIYIFTCTLYRLCTSGVPVCVWCIHGEDIHTYMYTRVYRHHLYPYSYTDICIHIYMYITRVYTWVTYDSLSHSLSRPRDSYVTKRLICYPFVDQDDQEGNI